MRLFAARQHAAGLAPKSIQRRLSGVRTFFAYLVRETLESKGRADRASRDGEDARPLEVVRQHLVGLDAPGARVAIAGRGHRLDQELDAVGCAGGAGPAP